MLATSHSVSVSPVAKARRKLLVLDPVQDVDLDPILLESGKWTIGSSRRCSISLPEEGIHPNHCLIMW